MTEERNEKIEHIGKVTMDYSKYPGEDFYCDGAVEDELLAIARDLSPVEYEREIGERQEWPILYHLSPIRENIVDWIPMNGTEKVLEVGSGCGAITGALARKAGSVTCVDLSRKRSMINAYRHSECDNVTIHVGNFKDIEPDLPTDFDYICLIGVFEYGQSYIGGEHPFEDFLKILLPHVKKDGRIVIAIENKYGLKYFAGCKEDHLGTYFSGIENYAEGGGVRTFSRRGLERIFKSCGVEQVHFYYPYPDYKFMHTLYSDAYLPGRGELSDNMRNFDQDRMVLFDEKNAFDGMVEDGLFSVFANSYVAILGNGFDVKYVKYSNDRAQEYRIRTEIARVDGQPRVRKYPMSKEAYEHVRNMALAYEKLQEKYAGGKLEINRCEVIEEGNDLYAQFEFVQGRPLLELMDECMQRDDIEGFQKMFREYVERTGYNSDFPVSDFDLIFGNLLVDGERWTLIDYEWTFGKPMPVKELAFRAIYYYMRDDEKRNKISMDWVFEELGITDEDAEDYWEREKEFQTFIRGERMSMAQMRDLIGHRLMKPLNWIGHYGDSGDVNRVQIYEDTTGEGYSEEQSYFVREAYQGDNRIELELEVGGDVRMLRIDPGMDSCMVKILEMTFNGVRVPLEKRKLMLVNGRIVKPADKENEAYQPSIVFPTTDPNINIDLTQLDRQAKNLLCARMEIVRIPLTIAEDMAGAVKKLI
ncbi:MAG: class I SAM-dependent methyltransferase [Lachnospiraceae bacterium]|nr:class I SAM-dependent methyltransferase [Lachnospiraceae bacterium]